MKTVDINNMEKPVQGRFSKYYSLSGEISDMIAKKGRGFGVAKKMNEAFWQDLDAHQKRMKEQIDRLQRTKNEAELQQELQSADSIYEAARNHIAKYR